MKVGLFGINFGPCGEAEAMRWLAGALRRYHEVAVAPYVPVTRAALAADQVARDAALRRGGMQGLMGSFDPLLRRDGRQWTGWYPVTRTLALRGRLASVDVLAFTIGQSLAALGGAWLGELAGDPRAAAWAGLVVGAGSWALLRVWAQPRVDRAGYSAA